MNRKSFSPLAVLALALACATLAFGAKANKRVTAAAQSRAADTGDSGVSFDAFRIISERNMFNSVRAPRVSRNGAEAAAHSGDTVTLVGTMESDKGVFAFFDSPEPKYRKARRAGQVLAPFTVTRISPEGVELARDGKPLTLKVGQQLRRPEGGEWTVIASEVVQAARQAEVSTSSPALNVPPPIPANASETLKRMMEQRRKQLNQ